MIILKIRHGDIKGNADIQDTQYYMFADKFLAGKIIKQEWPGIHFNKCLAKIQLIDL